MLLGVTGSNGLPAKVIVRQVLHFSPFASQRFFGTTAEFWMNLQTLYDIEEAQKRYKKDIESNVNMINRNLNSEVNDEVWQVANDCKEKISRKVGELA